MYTQDNGHYNRNMKEYLIEQGLVDNTISRVRNAMQAVWAAQCKVDSFENEKLKKIPWYADFKKLATEFGKHEDGCLWEFKQIYKEK